MLGSGCRPLRGGRVACVRNVRAHMGPFLNRCERAPLHGCVMEMYDNINFSFSFSGNIPSCRIIYTLYLCGIIFIFRHDVYFICISYLIIITN